MIVQMMAVPPTQEAMTISTVNVVRVTLPADAGAAEALADDSAAAVVTVTLALDDAAASVGVDEVAAKVVGAAVVTGVDEEDEEDVVAEEELLVVVEAVFVIELRMPVMLKGSFEDDEEDCKMANFRLTQ